MSDRVAVLRAGRIDQVGTPRKLYHHPASRFVAGFVGPVNEIFLERIEARDGMLIGHAADGLNLRLPVSDDIPAGNAWLILRPESICLGIGTGEIVTGEVENVFDAVVDDLTFTGATTDCVFSLGGARLSIPIADEIAAALQPGSRVRVGWNPRDSVVRGDA